ncbi:hypothetical protein TrVE_jg7791 [Triparma verrucosa]|uniref:Uncharacterized protein n=1 Tax=Triparma verrucosa TaxID=1606542 RepID=A0A9W7EWQ8_9STRA|nr:hypothetical protein TrVE_jg7791 [Triparma verrucosa]
MYQMMFQQQQASMMQARFGGTQFMPAAGMGLIPNALAKPDVKPETVSLGYASSQSLGGGLEKMPCRARGVPADHTFQTAYFIVKKGTPHGTLLKCSHPYCSEAGWKFRFCMFCKLPVAKRNFTKRHSHLPDQGGKKAPEPTSEEGQRILEELEQPVRLSKRERGFVGLLDTRPLKGSPAYDEKMKTWLESCVEKSKPEPPPEPKLAIPTADKPRISTRGSSAQQQQQQVMQGGSSVTVPVACIPAPMAMNPVPVGIDGLPAAGAAVGGVGGAGGVKVDVAPQQMKFNAAVGPNGPMNGGVPGVTAKVENGSAAGNPFHAGPVPSPAPVILCQPTSPNGVVNGAVSNGGVVNVGVAQVSSSVPPHVPSPPNKKQKTAA